MSPSILIVEDDAEICNLLVEALGELGSYATYVARSIDMARVSMRRPFQGPDLILLDTQLPDGNGISFCASLRQEGKYLPIIILSGHSTDDDIERAFEAGADDYLVKPFSISTLLAHVDAQLRHGGPKRDRRIVSHDRYTFRPSIKMPEFTSELMATSSIHVLDGLCKRPECALAAAKIRSERGLLHVG